MTTQKPISKSPISDACVGQGGCWQYGSTSAAVFGSAGRFSKSQPPRRVAFSAPSSLSQRATGSLLHTGKEKDPETGYSYFGARYLEHELMTMWLSVDPMADKYPSISPYAYCAWNPVRLVDPKGDSLQLLGDPSCVDDALRQIQSMTNNMTFSIDDKGMVRFSGKAKTSKEKYIKQILESNEVNVHLFVQTSSYYQGIKFDIGGFLGCTLNIEKGYIDANQVINLNQSRKEDAQFKKKGNFIWHEITEAYEGGCISLAQGLGLPMATDVSDYYYFQSHVKAGQYFPGSINSREVPIKYPNAIKQYMTIQSMLPQINKFVPRLELPQTKVKFFLNVYPTK